MTKQILHALGALNIDIMSFHLLIFAALFTEADGHEYMVLPEVNIVI